MEAMNITTAIQIATANKFFSRERGKHSEMPCNLSECKDHFGFIGLHQKELSAKRIVVNIGFTLTTTR